MFLFSCSKPVYTVFYKDSNQTIFTTKEIKISTTDNRELNLIVSKNFNLLEYNKNDPVFESYIELFNHDSVWKIEYKLLEITAENANIYKENINNYYLRDNENEIELNFYYLG